MSKIETHEVCTNLDENHRAPRNHPSAHDWENTSVHDMDRGTVIAFAKLIDNSLFETFQIFCIPTGSGRKVVNHHIKFAKYLLARMNLLKRYLRIVKHNLNAVASHIRAISMLPGFITYQYEHCGVKRYKHF